MQTDKTAEALKEFFNELTRIHEPVPAGGARQGEELPRAAAAAQLRDDARHGRRAGAGLSSTICRPTTTPPTASASARSPPADVKRVADKYIQPDKFAVVIVGDRKVDRAGRAALNLGPITVVEAAEIMK